MIGLGDHRPDQRAMGGGGFGGVGGGGGQSDGPPKEWKHGKAGGGFNLNWSFLETEELPDGREESF